MCGICKVEFNCSNVRLSISKKIYNGLVGLTGSQGRCGRRSGFDGIFFFRIKVSFRRFDFRFPELTNKASSSTFPFGAFFVVVSTCKLNRLHGRDTIEMRGLSGP